MQVYIGVCYVSHQKHLFYTHLLFVRISGSNKLVWGRVRFRVLMCSSYWQPGCLTENSVGEAPYGRLLGCERTKRSKIEKGT